MGRADELILLVRSILAETSDRQLRVTGASTENTLNRVKENILCLASQACDLTVGCRHLHPRTIYDPDRSGKNPKEGKDVDRREGNLSLIRKVIPSYCMRDAMR